MTKDMKFEFLGGSLKCRTAQENVKLPNGNTISWEKSLVIEKGKQKIEIGSSFIHLIVDLYQDDEFQAFIKDLK
jgi:hypothetical protein